MVGAPLVEQIDIVVVAALTDFTKVIKQPIRDLVKSPHFKGNINTMITIVEVGD
jgi:hypothetical protein